MTHKETHHRPELHFVPDSGILDAPAGIVRDGHTWHLFHQYRPDAGQPARWGHFTSEETAFAWLDCDDVLAPVGGELSLRAGSVAEGKDALNLYFTSVTSVGTSVRLARYTDYADECIVSDDPSALDPDVVRFGEAVGAHTNYDRFRSPSVVPDWAKEDREEGHDGWLMLALTGHSDAPMPVILDSPNGESWTLLGPLSFDGDPGFEDGEVPATSPIPPVVSPRLVRLRDEVDREIYDVLFVTLEREGRDVSGYIVGRLDGTVFTVARGFQRVDYGHDFSRPRNTNTTTGTIPQERRYDRAVILGLLNGNGRGDDATKHPTWEAEDVLDYLQPRELLGLTATPERGDGENVQKYFDYRVAHELRLWDALRLQLLAPLHYYGVDDATDLTSLTWNRGKKDYQASELSEFYIKAGEKRTRFIINELNRRIFDLSEMKALGFCVTIAHAEYMAEQFNLFGIPALAVSSKLNIDERRRAIEQLREGTIKIIFAVDIFNEGVDIPAVNTLLLLRPTQSPVLFVQQLGRGLRLNEGKNACTVFDFLGLQHEEFDFEERFKVLTAARGKNLAKEVEQGFPTAPPGSNITLDRVTTDRVLKNIKRLARNSIKKIRALITDYGTTDLASFINSSGVPVEDIYRRKGITWTRLLRDENLLPSGPASEHEEFLLSRIRVLLHINDPNRVAAYSLLVSPDGPYEKDMTPEQVRYATMLVLALWANSNTAIPETIDEALGIIRSCPTFVAEVTQVMRLTLDHSRVIPEKSTNSVLETHADYSLAELIGALDDGPLRKLANLPREGVRRFDASNTDLFLVTFQKDENVSASTNYRDYPLAPDRLHWESQSTTSLKSAMARRYIHHHELNGNIIIATRFNKRNKVDTASAYTFLGNVDYVTHSGEKPIQFEWSLRRDMPKQLYAAGRTVA
ncbi:DUF3427 domain-containing protein [Corynebacterium hesseae]